MVTIVSSKAFVDMHKPWYEHPENPERIRLVFRAIKSKGYDILWEKYGSIDYSLELAKRIHVKGYINYLLKLKAKAPCEIDPDTYFVEDTLDLALYALKLSYEYAAYSLRHNEYYVLLLRPPGHHVGRAGKALGCPTQGFCILNNAAAAVMGLKDQGVSKIVVLDIDVHCGNGTEEIFYDRNDVLNIDIHRDPSDFYPYTCFPDQNGGKQGKGYTVNLLLPRNAGDDIFEKYMGFVEELLESYNAEAIIVSLGLDGYIGDGLADTRLTENSYYLAGSLIWKTGLPSIVLLEGGYSAGLIYGLTAFLDGLNGAKRTFGRKTVTIPFLLRKYLSVSEQTIHKARLYLGRE
ncbi:MAG: histone deacetylase family protein [Crenarchaeota archaeon]|nr:histone deacetylase family protein [Thermoproteota archaeon]